MPAALYTLALAAFAIGTSEYVIMGLLPDLARDLHTGIPQAGFLVSGYALGVVAGAPILAIATARLPRKTALTVLIAAYAVGNALCALAPNYWLLMAARVLTAFCHGAFFGIGSVVAGDLVPQRRGFAIAIMFTGLTLANVLGVPFGTALGQWLGWRIAFWCVVVIALAATLAIARALPRAHHEAPSSLSTEFSVLRRPPVVLALGMSILWSASLFCVFTYITPMLEQVTHLAPSRVTHVLLLFGLGMTIGGLAGGRLGDWRLITCLAASALLIAAILVVLRAALPAPWQAGAAVFTWGLIAFTAATPLQMRVMDTAPDAPNLVATLNQGAFNLGNALGAWTGGGALAAGLGYRDLPLLGIALVVAQLGLVAASARLDWRASVREACVRRSFLEARTLRSSSE